VIAAVAPVCLEGRCRTLMKGLTQIGGLRFRVLRIGLCRETGVPTPQNCRLRSRLDGRVVTRCGRRLRKVSFLSLLVGPSETARASARQRRTSFVASSVSMRPSCGPARLVNASVGAWPRICFNVGGLADENDLDS
jgi:hypothetical protein